MSRMFEPAYDPKPTYDTIEDTLFPPEEIDEDEEKREAFWILTRKQLNKLTNEERACFGITPDEPGPVLARLYCDYLMMVQKLDNCWGQTYQYQKSQAMRKVLDAAMVRLMEIKNELTEKVDISELHYVDGQIIELKLIPHDLEIIKLSSIPVTRNEQLEELMKRLYNGERIYIPPKEDDEEDVDEEPVEIKPYRPPVAPIDPIKEQMAIAIAFIQKHERARLARLEYFDEIVMIQLKQDAITMKRGKKVAKEVKENAATKIQALWRAYVVRREMKKRNYRTRLEIKMDVPSWRDTKLDNIHTECILKKRRKREQKVREYIDTCIKEKERVLKLVGPGLMEDIGDEIRYWFQNWYYVAHAFDKYPSEEEGGTIMVVRGETMTPEEYRIEQERKRREKEKMKNNAALAKKMAEEKAKAKKAAAEAKKKEKERIKKEKKEAAKRAKAGIIEPFIFAETKGLKQISDADENMDEEWTVLDQKNMKNDDPIMEKITDQKCYEVQLEIRRIVDDLMRLELELLLAAHARDRKQKRKPPKKKKKKKKKKGKKDITGHRTIEDLFQELYDNRVIRTYPQYSLKDFYGDYSYNNYDFRAVDLDPLPAIGDIRQVVINNIILPLGGQTLPKPKSALICGPRSSGKHVLLYAICNECEAVMFDISPEILFGKYNGKKEMKLLCHMVNKVSRILQPSVIFIDGGEKPFYKKVPKPEKQFQPKKMKKYIFKDFVKPITAEDRVMLLATSNQPWNTAAAPFVKCFDKIIMIPRTDYGTVYQYWMDVIMKYHAVHRDINLSALAKLSVGYPLPYIKKVAEAVLCPSRIIRLKYEPLRCHELLEGLMTQGMPDPITIKEQAKFTKFFTTKVKIGKQRKKIFGIKRKAREEAEKQAEKERQQKNKK